ncbi:MAG: hypothetical protein AAF513_01985 [Pseudomonadota bacterium]
MQLNRIDLALVATLAICVVAIPSMANAHSPGGVACEAPLRPADDQNDVMWQGFLNGVDAYRDCVNRRKEFHEAAVAEHQASARAAVEGWNQFVRTSLNAPEDFPWPQSAQQAGQRSPPRPGSKPANVSRHEAFVPPATPLIE